MRRLSGSLPVRPLDPYSRTGAAGGRRPRSRCLSMNRLVPKRLVRIMCAIQPANFLGQVLRPVLGGVEGNHLGGHSHISLTPRMTRRSSRNVLFSRERAFELSHSPLELFNRTVKLLDGSVDVLPQNF